MSERIPPIQWKKKRRRKRIADSRYRRFAATAPPDPPDTSEPDSSPPKRPARWGWLDTALVVLAAVFAALSAYSWWRSRQPPPEPDPPVVSRQRPRRVVLDPLPTGPAHSPRQLWRRWVGAWQRGHRDLARELIDPRLLELERATGSQPEVRAMLARFAEPASAEQTELIEVRLAPGGDDAELIVRHADGSFAIWNAVRIRDGWYLTSVRPL